MAKLYLAALLAVCATPVQAQEPAAAVPVAPFVDSAEERDALRKMSVCLAKARPRWARQTLAHPYLSKAQAASAAEIMSGRDACVKGDQAELALRTSGMVGSLAEHYLSARIGSADFGRVAKALNTLAPLNASEDFALCVASRNPGAARDLALSQPGSAEETEASRKVAAHVSGCTDRREQLSVDMQSLRALVAVALYRGITTS
ncbi:MAG TPA: hypothetical protein VF650_01885 [Allosphingosinicella sp.]|jgi:hypothetical protein